LSLLSNYQDQAVRELLQNVKTIAMVGLSPKANRPSHRVARHLQSFSYRIVPVRPGVHEILGEKVYRTLSDIPFQVDLVNVFRASKYVERIVDECIERGIKKIWLQEGVIDAEAKKKARHHGISMVMDLCIYKEILRLGINQDNSA